MALWLTYPPVGLDGVFGPPVGRTMVGVDVIECDEVGTDPVPYPPKAKELDEDTKREPVPYDAYPDAGVETSLGTVRVLDEECDEEDEPCQVIDEVDVEETVELGREEVLVVELPYPVP